MAHLAAALPLAIFGWYASSAMSGVTSKQILEEYSYPFVLSAWQFTIAFGCHALYTSQYHPTAIFHRSENPRAHNMVVVSALAYSVGVCSFNAGFWAMHVSINETMRALEPLVGVALASTCLRDPQLSRLRLLALIPIVTGVYLSAISNAAFSVAGMAITMLANVAFPLRSALVKRIQPFMPLHVMFYSTLYYAMLLQWLLAGLWSVFGSEPAVSRAISTVNFKELLFSLFNGVFFYLYHWCSFVVLSSTDMVSHAVWNALRRVTTILFSVWYFDIRLHHTNAVGMVVACSGALLYAHALRRERLNTQAVHSHSKESHQIV